MSRAINTSLATIQFQVNARQASAAMQALQNMSNDLNHEIDKVKKNIKNLGEGVPKDNPNLLNYQNQLSAIDKQLKDVQKAQRDFLKGAKAADQLWKAASEGNIESLSFRSIKAGVNGLKKRQEGLSPGDAQDMKDWRIIKEVIDEADRVMKQAGADVQNVVQTIREGGKVSEQTMRQTINTLKELKGSVDETDADFRTYGNDLDFMEAKLQEFSDAQRRAKGEIVDANDARREMNKLTEEGAAATQREAEAAERKMAALHGEREELMAQREQIKQNIAATQEQIDKNHELIEEKHRQLAADEETFNAEQQGRRESIDGLKQQAETERKLANEKSDAAETHRRAAELQAQTTEQLTEKVTELQGKLEAQNAEPVKPKVDSSELEKIERKLDNIANLRKQQQEVIDAYEAKYGKTSDEQFEAQDKVRAEAVSKDVAAREAAVDKVNNKWEEYWKKQEAAAQEFARSLGKSLDEISPEGITSEQLSGPLAKSAQAAYKVTARRDYEFSEALGREGRLTEYKETARRYEGDDSHEAKVIESLQRKYREYTKELREANAVDTESKRIREEQRKESEAYYSALGQMQGFQEAENNLLQKKEGLLKQSTQKSEQQIQLEGQLADTKEQLRLAQEKQNEEQQEYVKLQGEAIEQGNKAAAAETKLADAQSEATQKQADFNQKQQEGLDNINQVAEGNKALQTTLEGQEQQLKDNSDAVRKNAEETTAAEQEKAQARQLSIKRMEEMLAALKEEYYTEELTAEKREEHKQKIKELDEAIRLAKGEWMSYGDAMKYASSIGSEGFMATDEQNKMATDALTRHREELIKTIQQKEADGQATATERAELEKLDQALMKVKTGFASADEVMARWAEHMNAGKTASESMAQTLDEKLAGATSSWDDKIAEETSYLEDCNKELDRYEQELQELSDELKELEQKHSNRSWLWKKTHARQYQREEARIEWLREDTGSGNTFDEEGNIKRATTKGLADDMRNYKQDSQERLAQLKQLKAEELGLAESEVQAEEKKADAKRLTNEQMQEGIKLLEEEYTKTDHTAEEGIKKRQQLREAIDQMNQELKESTGEWMKLADAEKLAEQAGKDTFLNKEGKGFIASPEEIQKATQALERRRDALIKNMKTSGEATKEQERELADLTKKIKDLKFEQDNLNMSQEKMQMLMRTPTNAVSLDELRAAIKRADGELKRMEGSLGQNNKQYQEFAEQVKNAKNQLKEMEGQAKATSTAWEKAWSRLKTYVGMYMGFNMAWQKVTGTADDLLELSDKMGEVRKTTGFTADEVGRLSDNLAKLDTRTNLTGLMEFSSLAGSIGMKTQEQVQGFTEAANMLAVSLPEMGNEASRTLMKIADATGDLEKNGGNVRETLERVGSTIIALRANSAAAAGPITDFVSRVGAVGAQAGISIDQIAALGATVDALGGRVEMSATALSRMIPAIKNNTFEVAKAIGMTEKELKNMTGMEQMVAIFRKLHDSTKGFDTSTEEGMNAMADSVEKALGRSTSMQEVMKELNQQGARAGIVFGLLSQNVDKLEEQLDTASEAYQKNTALMDEYSKMNDTTAAKLERLKNEIEEWFVSDTMQRWLGRLIDSLRALADWFSSDGVLATGFKMMLAYVLALKSGFGSFFTGVGQGFGVIRTAILSGVNVIATAAGSVINSLTGMTNAMRGVRAATIGARREWVKMDAAMKANVIGAVIAALAWLALKLWDVHKAAKEAAAETGRFNQQMADEKKALNGLFEPLNKSNMAQEERSKLIKEINSQYGRYLGYMLSEYSSAIQLADAHALIAKRIKEEAYERRLAEQERKVQDEHEEDMSQRYGWMVEQARGGVKGGADAGAIADLVKSYIDKNLANVDNDFYFGSLRRSNESVKKLEDGLKNVLERMVIDGKLTRDGSENLQRVAMQYLDVAKATQVDIDKATGNLRSDLRGIQGAIKVDLANNLNTLISNVANSVSNAVRQVQNKQQSQQTSPYLQRPGSGMPSLFGGGQQGGSSWQAPWQQNRETTPDQQMAPAGWKPNINKKDVGAVRQFVQDQEALRGALEAGGQQIDEAQRRVAESWLLTDKELKEYKAIVEKADRGPGGGNNNPYGDYNKVTSPYSQWNGDDLVARRKEMLERVRALANGADVQKVLSEDAKFISDAVRKNIKTTSDAIEWYNTERLKIQDALHAKHLTNTGDWLDPKKVARRVSRVVNDEMKYYLDELDAYYTERKTKIEEARNNEEITEAEAWRRTIKNENEWQQRRAELQKLYSKKRGEVTEQSENAILDIISERTGETTDFIKKDIAQTHKFILDVGNKSKAAMDRIFGDLDLAVEKGYLKAAQAIGKQMKFIEDTLAKERPYDGITKNLQENLDKMGVLAAQYKRINDELEKQGKEPKYSNQEITAQTYKEMVFFLRQAEEAWSIDIDELLRRMAEEGMVATAEEISKSELLKQAVMGQLRKTFEEVQNAVKKEASQIKKAVDILWNDDTRGPGGMSMKSAFDKAIARLGMQQDSVSRANSLIGAGVASDNVAARLAMKQIEMQMRMQKAQFDMYRVQAKQKMDDLKKEAAEHKHIADLAEKAGRAEEAAKERLQATIALRDAENVRKSLGLTLAEETKKEEENIANLLKLQEESQNRLYTELREWADLLTSSLRNVFEASHAGDEEYYNERAKLNLTGKGGPGAGTYIVIDNAGTEDATAHYEYLDERAALEREHEIEIQNAQAEAWRKVMDDINMKMSDMITDMINAQLQNASVDANTDATKLNTDAINGLTEAIGGIVYPIAPSESSGENAVAPLWPTSREDTDQKMEWQNELIANYGERNLQMQTDLNTALEEAGVARMPWQMTESEIATAIENTDAIAQARIDASNAATEKELENRKKIGSQEKQTDTDMVRSSQSAYSKMAQACNLYGIAYQAMSNDNLDAFQKFQMIALQSAGQVAIAMLTTDMFKAEGESKVKLPGIFGKAVEDLGPIAGPIVFAALTATLGGLMGMATSSISKSKSNIAQVTGASVGAGRLSTGMLTYAEGNVNEFTDPASLTPGRSYNVDGRDGKTYRAKYTGKDAKTHITSGPEFHLVGEKGREAIIDAHTTRLLQMDETGIWRSIQTLYNGGSLSTLMRSRRGRGVRAFAEGNLDEFDDVMSDGGGMMAGSGFDPEMLAGFQQSLDRNSAIMEQIAANGIEAFVSPYGPRGVVAGYDKAKKEAMRHGEKSL